MIGTSPVVEIFQSGPKWWTADQPTANMAKKERQKERKYIKKTDSQIRPLILISASKWIVIIV